MPALDAHIAPALALFFLSSRSSSSSLAEEQLAFADKIILNKLDLVPDRADRA